MPCEAITSTDQKTFDDMKRQDSFQYYRDVEIATKEGENMPSFLLNLSASQVTFVHAVNVL